MRAKSILICGAGVGGPALALQLQRYGFEPVLIERAPAFRDSGYMIDVWGTGFDLLERFGLLESTRSSAYIFNSLKFVNAQGREVAGFGGEVFRGALGDRFFSIPRGDLARTLFDAIGGKVETLYDTSVRQLRAEPDGIDVELTTGGARHFDLVIGADGLHSRVRELTFGPEAQFEKYLGYCAASFIAEDYPHRDEATYLSFARPGRQISRYAMRNGRTAFLFVIAARDKPAIASHDLAAQKRFLRETFGADGWECPQILARLDAASELYFDPVSQIRMPQWSRSRVALLGDAAYCPSLLAGAGSAFAMLGAYILAGELHKSGGDPEQAFAHYENLLHSFLLRQQNMAVRIAGSFTPKTALGIFLRDRAMNLMKITPIGVRFARSLAGENFVLPDYG